MNKNNKALAQRLCKGGNAIPVLTVTDGELISKIRIEAKSSTERRIAEKYGFPINRGDINRIKNGNPPIRADKRARLNLPVYVPAPICAIHGEVCLKKCKQPRPVQATKEFNVRLNENCSKADATGIRKTFMILGVLKK